MNDLTTIQELTEKNMKLETENEALKDEIDTLRQAGKKDCAYCFDLIKVVGENTEYKRKFEQIQKEIKDLCFFQKELLDTSDKKSQEYVFFLGRLVSATEIKDKIDKIRG